MTTEMTLEEELGYSAYAYEKMAREARTVQDRADHYAFARRLRQRAAWVRELGQRLDSCPAEKCGQCTLYSLLTGPIPGETAPAAPKEGTVKPCGPGCGTVTGRQKTPQYCSEACCDAGRPLNVGAGGATAGEAKPTGDAEKGGG